MLTWQRSQDYARDHGDGLRLRLRLTDAPSIAGLPWELLYDRRGNSFIAQSERTPVVRYLEVPQPPRPLTVDGALRILVVISSPTDLPELDVEAEWRRVQDALAAQGRPGHREDRPATGTDRSRPCRPGYGRTTSTSCTSSATATTTTASRTASSTSRTGTGAAPRSAPPSSAPTYATTTRYGWSCSTPASPPASTAPTRSAEWRKAWSNRTAPPSSPCSSPSPTAPPPRSPASSTAPWPTASPYQAATAPQSTHRRIRRRMGHPRTVPTRPRRPRIRPHRRPTRANGRSDEEAHGVEAEVSPVADETGSSPCTPREPSGPASGTRCWLSHTSRSAARTPHRRRPTRSSR